MEVIGITRDIMKSEKGKLKRALNVKGQVDREKPTKTTTDNQKSGRSSKKKPREKMYRRMV